MQNLREQEIGHKDIKSYEEYQAKKLLEGIRVKLYFKARLTFF